MLLRKRIAPSFRPTPSAARAAARLLQVLQHGRRRTQKCAYLLYKCILWLMTLRYSRHIAVVRTCGWLLAHHPLVCTLGELAATSRWYVLRCAFASFL